MGQVINFQKGIERQFRERNFPIDKLMQELGSFEQQAWVYRNEFYQLICKDPKRGIQKLPEYIQKTREMSPEYVFVESIAGGPNHDWTGPFLHILGMIYPNLPRELREEGLVNCLNYLDGLRYDYSQNHVAMIDEPWLVMDILFNRGIYSPGYMNEGEFLKANRTWSQFQKNSGQLTNDFFTTYAVIQPERSSLNVRKSFYATFPQVLDRTLDAAAAFSVHKSEKYAAQEGITAQELIGRKVRTRYDPLLHERIFAKIEQKNWIELPQ